MSQEGLQGLQAHSPWRIIRSWRIFCPWKFSQNAALKAWEQRQEGRGGGEGHPLTLHYSQSRVLQNCSHVAAWRLSGLPATHHCSRAPQLLKFCDCLLAGVCGYEEQRVLEYLEADAILEPCQPVVDPSPSGNPPKSGGPARLSMVSLPASTVQVPILALGVSLPLRSWHVKGRLS